MRVGLGLVTVGLGLGLVTVGLGLVLLVSTLDSLTSAYSRM